MTRSRGMFIGCVFVALPAVVLGQQPEPSPPPAPREFRIGGELKTHFRHSKFLERRINFPFPPSFLPPGQAANFMRTVSRENALELSNAALRGEGEITSGVSAKVEVHFLDLYNRNPTSSDDRVLVREAWLRLGQKPEPLQAGDGSRAYLQLGLAPRFSRQALRRLESYGLWSTAVARFEQPQVELGLRLGHAYVRGMFGNGNPLFLRDPNALAGDNFTPETASGNVDPIYQTGFPILYDAKPQDLNPTGRFEWGAGLGARFAKEKWALDAALWRFERRLAQRARIRGSYTAGDLELLRGVSVPLSFSGNRKSENGVNLEARFHGLRFFGQYVDQDVATLGRRGLEAELAWLFDLNGLFLIKESPFGNWIQPVVRFSMIDNRFSAPRQFLRVPVGWDWKKYDFGLRFGLVRGADLTIEYARNIAVTATVKEYPDEFLATLRVAF